MTAAATAAARPLARALLCGALAAACASTGGAGRFDPPAGERALGLDFGAGREAVTATLDAQGVAHRADPDDPDVEVADGCRGGAVPGACRLRFGPRGLYAAEQQVPAGRLAAVVRAVSAALGPARSGGDPLAAWERDGWRVVVERPAGVGSAEATLRVERDEVTPPTVVGVPLGRRREAVERALAAQGAEVIHRDDESTSFLGCPLGDPGAVSCTVTYRRGRAAAVTEVVPAPGGDRAALSAWEARALVTERELGRPPEVSCPEGGPQRVGGDCTATWISARLVVVVGAHRGPGGEHRGAISLYAGYAYPPLDADQQD
jgi:hypothetical protein